MTTVRRVVALSAGLRAPSSTRLLADRLGEQVVTALRAAGADAELHHVELREHAHPLTDALLTGFPAGSLRAVVDTVVAADGLIVVTPTFSASYNGLFKSFFDILEPDALVGKPVLLAATGGTERHSLVLDYALRPLFSHLGAAPVRTGVYAATGDFGGPGTAALARRVDRAAAELARAVLGTSASAGPAADPPEVTPFEELLGS